MKAFPAEDGSSLGGLKGDCCLLVALGTDGTGFRANTPASAGSLGLALLAMLGVVDEFLIVKEKLLA